MATLDEVLANEKVKKAFELANDEGFRAELEGVETTAELQGVFSNHGLDLNDEDFIEIADAATSLEGTDEELDESDLDAVSGGYVNWRVAAKWGIRLGGFINGCLGRGGKIKWG